MRFLSGPTSIAAYLGIAVLSSRGSAFAILGLATSFLFTMLSPLLAPAVPAKSILRFTVLAGALIGALKGRHPIDSRNGVLLETTWLVVASLLANAVVASAFRAISVLKAISFGTTILVLVTAWAKMSRPARETTERLLYLISSLVVVASAVLSFTSSGYCLGRGLCGTFSHPQAAGPFAGILASAALVRCISIRPAPRIDVALLFMCLWVILFSRARTGALAFVGGTGAALFFGSDRNLGAARAKFASALGGISLLASLFLGPVVVSEANKFLVKDSSSTELAAIAQSSRGTLVDKMLANFQRSPLVGIGFGAPSDLTLNMNLIEYDPLFGIPISATVEKGVLPVAMLEELGLPLAMLIFLWMASIGRRAFSAGLLPTAIFSSAMAANLAENMFFSFGGFGLLVLILVTWAITAPIAADNERRARRIRYT